jgi:hypothetical protein
MGEVICETDIPREKGWLYYTSTDKNGNLTICKSPMGGRKKEIESKSESK